jgi:hypothetical protein
MTAWLWGQLADADKKILNDLDRKSRHTWQKYGER